MKRQVFFAAVTVAVATGLFSAGGAIAASFDCAKAQTSVEMAICANPALSRLDDQMLQAYLQVFPGLSVAAQKRVQAGQVSWISYRDQACTDTAQPKVGAYDADGIACLSGVYRDRIARLGETFNIGGLRFYPADTYGVLADPEASADSWNKVATKQVLSLRLDGAGPLAGTFNTYMDRIDASALKDMPGAAGAKPDPYSDSETQIGIDTVTPVRISLDETGFFYGHGAAHPNSYQGYHHFLRSKMRPLVAGDIFASPDFATQVEARVVAILRASYGADAIWDDATLSDGGGLSKTIGNPQNWAILPQGLGIQFQPYEVAAYVYGAPMAFLPWASVSDLLTDTVWDIVQK